MDLFNSTECHDIDSNIDHINSLGDLIQLFSQMNINSEETAYVFKYKGNLIRSKEDFKQLIIREMQLPY